MECSVRRKLESAFIALFLFCSGQSGHAADSHKATTAAGSASKANTTSGQRGGAYVLPELTEADREAIKWNCENRVFGPDVLNNPELYEGASYLMAYSVDAYYVYVGFLEVFPSTSRRPEIERRMAKFRVYVAPSTPQNHVLPLKELRDRFNWNGNERRGGWGRELVRSRDPETNDAVFQGQIVMGNLMFDGAVSFLTTGVRVAAGTKMIFPTTKAPTLSEIMKKKP